MGGEVRVSLPHDGGGVGRSPVIQMGEEDFESGKMKGERKCLCVRYLPEEEGV